MTPLLVAEKLELAYGEAVVCRDVSFEIAEGEIVALIGANGAGKSTTLRAVAGALLPRAGSIRFRSTDLTRMPSYARTNLGIALVPEGRHVFPFLTVRENLDADGGGSGCARAGGRGGAGSPRSREAWPRPR